MSKNSKHADFTPNIFLTMKNKLWVLFYLSLPSPLTLPSCIYLPNCVFFLVSLVEITIRVDESDCLSMASSHDQETERFLSTGTTGRRVSFNEAALFDHGKKAQEKGRRSERRFIHRNLHLQIAMFFFQCSVLINVHTLQFYCCLRSDNVHFWPSWFC